MFAKQGDLEVLNKQNLIGFLFEPKHSGLRVFILKDEDNIQIFDRLGRDITFRFPELLDIHSFIKTDSCILDAELVVLASSKEESVELMEIRSLLKKKSDIDEVCLRFPAKLIVFDIVEKDTINITDKPFRERRKILKEIIKDSGLISLSEATLDGKELWNNLHSDYDGIIAKDLNSKYEQGAKSWSWLKIKKHKTTECVLLGYRKNKEKMEIILGLFDSRFHMWFSPGKILIEDKSRISNILGLIKERELKQDNSILNEEELNKIEDNKKFKWLSPEIIVEIIYDSINEKTIINPQFLRLRVDKEAKECFI